ncbi:MAG: sulfurtransferase TusA family protein [Chloroflexota bacterium]|nr:sulfurtransferase TusA family protein [Chloroflexota bacterium]
MNTLQANRVIDCSGMSDPLPTIKTSQAIKEIQVGQVLQLIATYSAAPTDIPAWSRLTGNEVLHSYQDGAKFVFYLRRVK